MFHKLLTTPKEHNPNNFIYLVHSFMDQDNNGFSFQGVKDRISKIKDVNQFYSSSLIGQLDEQFVKEKFDLGNNKNNIFQIGTFGAFGLIINPVYDDVIQIA